MSMVGSGGWRMRLNLAQALVAVHDDALAREHQSHWGQFKSQSVIGQGMAIACVVHRAGL